MIDQGQSERAAAAALSVSAKCAHKWKHRWLQATPEELASGVWARDRSSRPHFSPRRSSLELERLKVGLTECIGCGCLSLDRCRLANPGDRAAAGGPGPRYWIGERLLSR